MNQDEYDRQVHQLRDPYGKRPLQRTGKWWVGAFAVVVSMLLVGGCMLALCLGL